VAETICELWRESVRAARRPPFLVQQQGGWKEVGWPDAAAAVDEIAAGFLALGIGPGDRVAILCRSRLEWTLVDYALISLGAISATIFPTSSAEDVAFILRDSGAKALVLESPQHAHKIGQRPDHLILVEGEAEGCITLAELRGGGRALLSERPGAVDDLRDRVMPDDLMTLIYTSGTTGQPKGCMLTQRNYAALVAMVNEIDGLFYEGDLVLLYLPLAHTFARTVELVATTVGTIAYCPDPASLVGALRDVRPTVLPTSPRLFERFHAAALSGFERGPLPRRLVARWALAAGHRRARAHGLRALELRLADRLVYAKTRERLGGRMRHAISGGASLAREIGEFFDALGVIILEGYGLTECSVASVNRPGMYRFGTVGPPLPGVEARRATDGELLIRGENVFHGYWNNAEATSEALPGDGWLHTGDIVEIDADSHIRITDRKRDIMVLAGGTNVAPQRVEAALAATPAVTQAFVVGDGRPYVAALLLPDPERSRGLGDAELESLMEEAVAVANRTLGKEERVRRFGLLPRELSESEGEITPTLKVRRRIVEARFRAEIERLYAGGRADER